MGKKLIHTHAQSYFTLLLGVSYLYSRKPTG